jgi:hypothetical protein
MVVVVLIQTVTLTGSFQRILPPPQVDQDNQLNMGPFSWTLINGTTVTTIAQDAAGDQQATLAAGVQLSFVAEDEELWAKGTGTITVIGAAYPSS